MVYRLVFFLFVSLANLQGEVTIETLYGTEIVEDPLILELLASPAMERLKGIDQSGMSHYIGKIGPYSRYIHSFGVYQLLKKFGASREEQVAGLLHDASHTVFSHTGDWLFNHGDHFHAYQDEIHAWYLAKQGIEPILERYGMTLKDALPKDNGYELLDQELPDVCADRLEYNLFTGHLVGLLTEQDVSEILADVHYEEGRWYFEDPVLAAKFAKVSVYCTENYWAAPFNVVSNEFCARALKRALELQLLDLDDIHFAKDAEVLDRLLKAEDAEIQTYLEMVRHIDDSFTLCEAEEADYICKCKFRGIDPLVKINGHFVRLTSLDENFSNYYYRIKEWISHPVCVAFTKKLIE